MTTLRTGLILGILLVLWTFIMGFTGWYRHPSLFFLMWLAIPLQVGALLVMLKLTAPTAGYLRQVQNGVGASIVASAIVFLGSLLFTLAVFPAYFAEMEALGRLKMAQQGLGAEQIEAMVRAGAPMQTSLRRAFVWAFETSLTGLFTSIVGALWLRKT